MFFFLFSFPFYFYKKFEFEFDNFKSKNFQFIVEKILAPKKTPSSENAPILLLVTTF